MGLLGGEVGLKKHTKPKKLKTKPKKHKVFATFNHLMLCFTSRYIKQQKQIIDQILETKKHDTIRNEYYVFDKISLF